MTSKIIKATTPSHLERSSQSVKPDRSKVIGQEVHAAQQKAREILQDAHRRANEIVEGAERKIESRLEQLDLQIAERRHELAEEAAAALEESRRQGHDEGFARWQQLLMEAHGLHGQVATEAQEQLVRLALKVGAKLHRSRLDVEPDSILPLVQDSLSALGGVRGEIEIHLHPQDAQVVEGKRQSLVDQDPRWRTMVVVRDETLSRGSCRVVSAVGTVDATVESQLRAMEEHLLGGAGA
jgi:flagellar biosynthesis/type III secretory pathway protein FliH